MGLGRASGNARERISCFENLTTAHMLQTLTSVQLVFLVPRNKPWQTVVVPSPKSMPSTGLWALILVPWAARVILRKNNAGLEPQPDPEFLKGQSLAWDLPGWVAPTALGSRGWLVNITTWQGGYGHHENRLAISQRVWTFWDVLGPRRRNQMTPGLPQTA